MSQKSVTTLSLKFIENPTQTDTIFHNSSNHPEQHKHAAIYRLINILANFND